jgi:hypothetical protein
MRRPGGWGFYRRCQLLSHRAPCFTPQPSFTTSAMVRITQWSIRRTLTHAPSLAPKKASPPDRVLQVPRDWRSRKAVEVCGALKVHSVLAQPRQPYTWKANKALYTQPCSGSTCSAIQNIESKSVRRLFMSKAVESVYRLPSNVRAFTHPKVLQVLQLALLPIYHANVYPRSNADCKFSVCYIDELCASSSCVGWTCLQYVSCTNW